MKICSTCKVEKDESEFHKCKKTKSGLQAKCKVCRNSEIKSYKEKNREEYLRKSREYAKREYEKNPEKFIERHKEWKKNNPEILIESNRKSCIKSYQKFKEKRKVYYKLYRERCSEEKKIRDAEWRLKNPDKVKEYGRVAARNQRKNDPEKVSARLAVMHEIKMGRIVKPNDCSRCLKECKPEGHHPDYSKPLEVIWLCKQCHIEEHKK